MSNHHHTPSLPTAATPADGPPFGVLLNDWAWPYGSPRQNGGVGHTYDVLDVGAADELPIRSLLRPGSVVLSWTTGPFMPEALRMHEVWGIAHKTIVPWFKCKEIVPGVEPAFRPHYSVGYWARGAAEYILLGQVPGGRAYRTPWIALLSDRAEHSRKPDSIYELAESFPGPYLELFARRRRDGWTQFGNELPGDGRDIRDSLADLAEEMNR